MSRVMSKTQLKARLLACFREVEETGEEIIVTSHGKPVLRVSPVRGTATAAALFADVRDRVSLPPDEELTAPAAEDLWADSDVKDLVR